MSKIVTDPRSIEILSKTITQSATEIEATLKKLRATLNNSNWNDVQRQKFENDFQELTNSLKTFTNQAPKTAAYLNKKAAQLRDYNSR